MTAMKPETVLRNARIVLAGEVVHGDVVIRDGVIASVSAGPAARGEDLDGDFLLPGLVELHTDHLETHLHPRPGVLWPVLPALVAHDAQIAAAGITTVFDALRAGTFDAGDREIANPAQLAQAIHAAKDAGALRADHFVHVRCELPCADTVGDLAAIAAAGDVRLVSLMDHTPGARQFVSLEKFRQYYIGKKIVTADTVDAYIEEKRQLQQHWVAPNKDAILDFLRQRGVRLASHDDATEAHVGEAIADGASIAEFPTTAEAAAAAHRQGLAVLMGAPNVVRGVSHSGNISARAVARAGHLDILSSDYVPASLLAAAFALTGGEDGLTLPEAVATVTANPARAVGLDDRGAIAPGLRADLVRVRLIDGQPVVRAVWRTGERVV
jgi:alpha-D-ribose 1-methylphosphonate 5-triphosphate diphosphatase